MGEREGGGKWDGCGINYMRACLRVSDDVGAVNGNNYNSNASSCIVIENGLERRNRETKAKR
jgi:hypothetical protein